MRDPANIDPDDQRRLNAVLTASPRLTTLTGRVRAFDDRPALHSFVVGIRRDQDVVTAGLTLPWNSGAVEGHVNRF